MENLWKIFFEKFLILEIYTLNPMVKKANKT